MTRCLYITGIGPESSESLVAIGLMETLIGKAQRVGFFRPVVADEDEPDPQLELIRRRYRLDCTYADMHAVSALQAQAMIAQGRRAELEQRAFDAYKRLERRFDVVVCEGTDVVEDLPALDFDLNVTLAKDFGCPLLVVVRGSSVSAIASAVRVARAEVARKGGSLFGVIVTRVPSALMADMRAHSVTYDREQPLYVLTDDPALEHPTVSQVAAELGADVLTAREVSLHREVRAVRVAAMSVEHFIEDLQDGTLVIVPADRADIVLASLAASVFPGLPAVAGVLLTGPYELAGPLRGLLPQAPFPILRTATRTYSAATAVHAISPVMTAEDEAKIATAIGVFQAGIDPGELAQRIALPRPVSRTPMMFEYDLLERARARRRHIVLPEGNDERVLSAADILLRRDVVDLTILGSPDEIQARAAACGLKVDAANLVDPLDSPLRDEYARTYQEMRAHKGVTAELAFDAVADSSYFGTLMVHAGAADGMVSGACHTTADTIRPAFEIIRSRPDVGVVSSVFFMCLADRVLVYGDCAVNPRPTAEQLADIAVSSADTAARFGIDVRVALLSYSTGASGTGEQVELVRHATELARQRRPDLELDGPIQYDAAVDAEVARIKLPDSAVAGRATVLVFPDLDTGNVAYKAVQRSAGALAVGPVLQGLRKPVNDLSRGCGVSDIVTTVAITAVQAQEERSG